MHPFLTGVFESLNNLQPEMPVLVGFSGGADSVCLLHVLHRSGIPVIAAHYNHQMRPDAAQDAEFSATFAGSLGIPFVVGSGEVLQYARQNGLSLESAARQMRYRFLFAEAARQSAQAVAVAHHADDQAETVLLHILRGAGSHGLQGMQPQLLPNPWSQKIPLLRPLLSRWKEEIVMYCRENGLQYREDESNQDQAFLRNAIRHTILPALESCNPQVRQALWRLSQVAADEQVVIAEAAEAAWQASLRSVTGQTVRLDAAGLRASAPALQRLVLRRAVACLRPGIADVDFAAIERGRAAILKGQTGEQVDLVGGLRLEMLGQDVRLAAWEDLAEADWPQLDGEQSVHENTAVQIGKAWVFQSHVVDLTASLRQSILENGDPFQAWVDPAPIQGSLSLRPRWPGAQFQPLGMWSGSQKISDLMINHKIPRPARAAWPLLCSGQQIVWAPGLAVAHPYRVTSTTKTVLHLTLKTQTEPGS